MIKFSNLALRRGTRSLFSGLSCTIPKNARVGVCGRNGCGKSTLFSLLRGELQSDVGDARLSGLDQIAAVKQEVPTGSRTALDFVVDGDVMLREIQAQIERAELEDDGLRLANLHSQFESIDGYTAPARAAQLLTGLGFADSEHCNPVDSFSGGWRMRLALAQALMCRSDLLLLDEPTNHLDLETVWWLERWLKRYQGTLLVIAHDREFLDGVVDHVIYIHGSSANLYKGNFSSFERQLAEQLQQQASAHGRQQREIQRIQRFVDRFRAKATKARQAQSRVKALERMQLVSAVHVDAPFRFGFENQSAPPNPLVNARDLNVGYGQTSILRSLKFSLGPGSRIGLIGVNGAGKSTLIKALAGEISPTSGELTVARGVRVGYFAQHQIEALDQQATPLVLLGREATGATEQVLRNFLGGFGFSDETVKQTVSTFSGGERARLALALLVWRKPNLLLLDEPTNHLDMDMRHALTVALQSFEGAVVLVSHDRHLIRTVTDELWLVAGGVLNRFDGDLDDYTTGLGTTDRTAVEPKPSAQLKSSTGVRQEKRRDEADLRAKIKPMKARADRIEGQIEKLTAQRDAFDEKLASGDLYVPENKETLREVLFDRARVSQRIEELEANWLQEVEAIDALQ